MPCFMSLSVCIIGYVLIGIDSIEAEQRAAEPDIARKSYSVFWMKVHEPCRDCAFYIV